MFSLCFCFNLTFLNFSRRVFRSFNSIISFRFPSIWSLISKVACFSSQRGLFFLRISQGYPSFCRCCSCVCSNCMWRPFVGFEPFILGFSFFSRSLCWNSWFLTSITIRSRMFLCSFNAFCWMKSSRPAISSSCRCTSCFCYSLCNSPAFAASVLRSSTPLCVD